MRAVGWIVALSIASLTPAVAQDRHLPASELSPDADFVRSLDGAQVRMLNVAQYEETLAEFRAELAAHDPLGIIRPGVTTADQVLEDSDVMVVILDTFEQAADYWEANGLGFLADTLRDIDPTLPAFSHVQVIYLSERPVILFTFPRIVLDQRQQPRCMARYVIDNLYGGVHRSTFFGDVCSQELQ